MIVDTALYREGTRVPLGHAADDVGWARSQLTGDGDFVWIGLHQPTVTELEDVAVTFGLHPLAIEDALNAHQRPKLERYGDSLFFSLKTLWYVDENDAVETGEINIFMGEDYVITVRHGDGTELHSARQRLERHSRVLKHGPSAVLYVVCDVVVDSYETVAAALEVDVDEVEGSVFSEERTNDAPRIYTLKREIAEMRRAVQPLREPIRLLTAGAVRGVPAESGVFFRDVGDHLMRVSESIDSLDILLSTAFDAHLAAISVQQNEDMRKISAGVGLVAVPTLVAGVYGMNFEYMPELHWSMGYPFSLILMGVSSLLLWVFFKRSGWL